MVLSSSRSRTDHLLAIEAEPRSGSARLNGADSSCPLRLNQMAAMGYHDLVAVTIRVQGGTHFLPYRLPDSLLHDSDITGISR